MKKWQASLPAPFRGEEINVTEAEYDSVLAKLREITGYDGLARGDLWVHISPGSLRFGYLTRCGETAFHKHCENKGLTIEERVPYATG